MKNYLFYDFVKVTAALPGILWLRPKYVYQSDKARCRIKGGALVVSNHVGFLDPVYLMGGIWYRRHHFICRKEFFDGWYRIFFKGFHCIPIDRGSVGTSTIREITEHLKDGELVTMFPEGHLDGNMQFKAGMVLMAMQAQKPIVPVYIVPKKHFLSRLTLVIGEPIDVHKLVGDRPSISLINEAAATVNNAEIALKSMLEEK